METLTATGTVIFFNKRMDYGFIDIGEADHVFVRRDAIDVRMYKDLHEGQPVKCEYQVRAQYQKSEIHTARTVTIRELIATRVTPLKSSSEENPDE